VINNARSGNGFVRLRDWKNSTVYIASVLTRALAKASAGCSGNAAGGAP
jgi:hypothetical protein